MKAESVVQTEIIKFVKSQGQYVFKVMKANMNGVHDLIICWDGQFISCEVKAEKFSRNPSKQMSAWQHKQMDNVRASKGISMCVASLEQFIDEIYDYYLNIN